MKKLRVLIYVVLAITVALGALFNTWLSPLRALAAGTYPLAYGANTAALAYMSGSADQHTTGAGAWAKVYPSAKAELYLSPEAMGAGAITVADIAGITYHTFNTLNQPQDFYVIVYTDKADPSCVGAAGSWYCHKLTGEPYLALNYTPAQNTWTTWTTDAAPTNQLRFIDSDRCGNFGFYGQPTWQTIQSGPITWQAPSYPSCSPGYATPIDYRTEKVLYLSIQTGSGWSSFNGYVDAISMQLTNGNTYTIDLENVPSEVWVDDDWATVAPGQEVAAGSGHFMGYNAFATITTGIAGVSSGGIVHVESGTYPEDNIDITKPLTIQGAGSSETGSVIDATASSATGSVVSISLTDGNVTFDGFRVLTGQSLNGMVARSTSNGSVITISHNFIEGWRTSAHPARTCGTEDNFNLIAQNSSASLIFQYNDLLAGCSNAILLERHTGPSDVSYNTWDRSIDDVASDGYFDMNYGGADITNLHKVSNNVIDMGGGSIFTNNERGAGITFAASYTGAAGGYQNIQVTANRIFNLKPYRRGISLWNNAAAPGTPGGFSGAIVIDQNEVEGNASTDAGSIGVRLLGRIDDLSVQNNVFTQVETGVRTQAWNSHITSASEMTLRHNLFTSATTAVDWQGSDTLIAVCNYWGTISGPTAAGNPGGLGLPYTGNLTFSPWLIDPAAADSDPVALGFQLPTAFTVVAGADTSAADNNYRSLANAIGCVADNQTINLSGTFDFAQPNALASWPLGTDAITGTNDDWEVDVPANADGVTLTAASLGDAIIQGPGDVPTVDLEGFLQFYNNGTNQNWTISKLDIRNFDLSIGMYCCGGSPSTAYNGTTITGNHILMASDLKGESASGNETLQNIAIHMAYGKNQTLSNNTIDVPGDGLSDAATDGMPWYGTGAAASWMYAVDVVLQTNTSGGNAFDGLLIDHNTVQVLNAPSAYPQRVIGLWENGHAHTSNITLSNNTFINLDAGNSPFVNRQVAFRPTSHSSASTTVQYSDNQITDWAIGFYPMSVSAGNLPIQMTRNQITGALVGYLLGPNENWNITNSALGNPIYANSGVGVLVPATAQVGLDGVSIESFDVGLQITGTATLNASHLRYNQTGVLLKDSGTGSFNSNEFAGNILYAINNTTTSWVDANNSWWGDTTGPMDPEPACTDGECNNPGLGDRVSNLVHYMPYTTISTDVSAAFTTQAEPVKAILNWETTTEEFILSFNTYRADSETGLRTLLAPSDIPAKHSGQVVGDSYTLTDATVVGGNTYYYWLEIVDTNGRSTFIGPRVQYIKKASSLALISSKNPSVLGDTVTFTATLGQLDATGVITFTADGATLTGCGGVVVANGHAACTASALVAGTHPILAAYNGDAAYFGSASAALDQVVNKKTSSLTLASSKNPAVVGDTVTFTATITLAARGALAPTVTFQADGADIAGCVAKPVSGGKATCAVGSLAAGTHPITARYSGDDASNGSDSAALQQVVNKKPSSLTLASSLNPARLGDTLVFTATLAQADATGTITFQADGVNIAGCVTLAVTNGQAVCTTSALAGGTHAITALYNGSPVYLNSASSALEQVIEALRRVLLPVVFK